MFILGTKLTRILVVSALSLTAVIAAPTAQAAVLEGPGHALSSTLVFDSGSTVLKPGLEASLQGMLAQVPSKPWYVVITVTTSEATQIGRGHTVAVARVNAVVNYLKSRLEAAGVPVIIDTAVWYQPGLLPRFAPKLRNVYADLNW